MGLYEKHIFVCENQRAEGDPKGCCFSKGSPAVTAALKKLAAESGLGKKIRINKAGCLGQCALGTAVVVYPEGIWHKNVNPEDAEKILVQVHRQINLPQPAERASLYERYKKLTMPTGALDSLMQPTLQVLAQRKEKSSTPLQVGFLLFAGDHAVSRQHAVSAYPPEVTPQMVANIVSGGAAISQLAARRKAHLMVCDVGVAEGFEDLLSINSTSGVTFERHNLHKQFPNDGFQQGARDITVKSALTSAAHEHCWKVGAQCVDEFLKSHPCDVLALGEMGIGNTTPATAIAAASLESFSLDDCVGSGTGIDAEGLQRKRKVIEKSLARAMPQVLKHSPQTLPWAHDILTEVGGAELSALAGAAWRAAERGVMVLLDGLIVTAAIFPFALAESSFSRWLIASHQSAEQAHQRILSQLKLKPLLQLGLRLGEGSGAAFAAGLLQDADTLLREMATFESANVNSN